MTKPLAKANRRDKARDHPPSAWQPGKHAVAKPLNARKQAQQLKRGA
jgi:hypothetical protein